MGLHIRLKARKALRPSRCATLFYARIQKLPQKLLRLPPLWEPLLVVLSAAYFLLAVRMQGLLAALKRALWLVPLFRLPEKQVSPKRCLAYWVV